VDGSQGGACKAKGAGHPAVLPQAKWLGPSAEQKSLRPSSNTIVSAGRVVKATPPADPQHSPGPVTEAPMLCQLNNTRNTGKITKGLHPMSRKALNRPRWPSKRKPRHNEMGLHPNPKSRPSRTSPIFLITLPSTRVWNLLVVSSHPSPLSLLGQLARGLFPSP